MREEALEEYFKQPVLVREGGMGEALYHIFVPQDTFDVRIVMAKPVGHMTDFLTAAETDLIE